MANVPKINYSFNDIKLIVDDSLSSTNLHKSAIHNSDAVRGDYADPIYCPGTTDDDRKLALLQDIDTDGELHGGYWRNYGPQNATNNDGNVEIHFASMIDRAGTEHVDTEDVNDLQYVMVFSYPPFANIIAAQTMDYEYASNLGSVAGSYYNGVSEDFGKHTFAIKIGFNQDNVDPSTIEYKIKVTTYLGSDHDVEDSYYYTVNNTEYTVTPVWTLVGMGTLGSLGYPLVKVVGNLPIPGGTDSYNPIRLIKEWVDGKAGTFVGAEAIAGVAAYIMMIQLASAIFNVIEDADQLQYGMYNYNAITGGMYTIDDIKDSTFKIGIGNSKNNNDKVDYGSKDSNTFISPILDMEIEGDRTVQYINLDFHPQGVQYDPTIPPPLVHYKIELIATKGCTLSTTKPVILGVMAAPNGRIKPEFGISPDYTWKRNDIAEFFNAKYCDYILIKDIDKGSDRWWTTILGSFNTFTHITIGTNANGEFGPTIHPEPITEKVLALPVPDIFLTNYTYLDGLYQVIFCNDKYSPSLMNWEFLNRQTSGDPITDIVKKYWIIGDNWEISNGALYKLAGIGSTYQTLVNFKTVTNNNIVLYTLDFNIIVTSGTFYININGLFDSDLYTLGVPTIVGADNVKLDEAEYPEGITFSDGYLCISSSINFHQALLSIYTGSVEPKLIISGDNDTTGYITYCKCIKTSTLDASDSDRATPLAQFNINVVNEYNTKSFTMIYVTFEAPVTIGFTMTDIVPDTGFDVNDRYIIITYREGTRGSTNEITQTINIEGSELVNDVSLVLNYAFTVTSIVVETRGIASIGMFTCNDSGLTGIIDHDGVFYNAGINLDYTSFGRHDLARLDLYTLSDTFSKLTSLSCQHNEYLTEDLSNWKVNVINTLNLSYTNVYGDIGQLQDTVSSIILEQTRAINYIGVESLHSLYTKWVTTNQIDDLGNPIHIAELYMIRLIKDLYRTTLYDGTLIINEDNDYIIDITSIEYINEMIDFRRWNILYNKLICAGTITGSYDTYYACSNATITNINIPTQNDIYSFDTIADAITFIDTVRANPTTTLIGANWNDVALDGIAVDYIAYDSVNICTPASIANTICIVGLGNISNIITDATNDINIVTFGANSEIIDIYNYPTLMLSEVTIGTQTWMSVNLEIDDSSEGVYSGTYGKLYNWDAAIRIAANIDGWHLPNDAEWTILIDYLGGSSVAGGKLKETGTIHWLSPNTGATNETGFTALPGGYRGRSGTVDSIGKFGFWWSATEYLATNAYYRAMSYSNINVNEDNTIKEYGLSVRLIKD